MKCGHTHVPLLTTNSPGKMRTSSIKRFFMLELKYDMKCRTMPAVPETHC